MEYGIVSDLLPVFFFFLFIPRRRVILQKSSAFLRRSTPKNAFSHPFFACVARGKLVFGNAGNFLLY